MKKTNASILKDLVWVTSDQYEFDEKPILTFDASKECRIEKFLSDDEIQNEDAEILRKQNEYLK